jgi:putative oxidoreductase
MHRRASRPGRPPAYHFFTKQKRDGSMSDAKSVGRGGVRALVISVVRRLDSVPYWVLALPARLAVADVFWRSGTEKLANWNTTLALFSDEYKLPLIPPEIAAPMAASIELSTPFLLVAGFLTRPAAALLLGMTTVIEVFVYPEAWPTHIQWASMLLFLLCRGPGTLSVDHWVARRWGKARPDWE